MTRSSLVTVKCSKCGRRTHVFGKTDDNKIVCAVCIVGELMDEIKPQVGPSEVKDALDSN